MRSSREWNTLLPCALSSPCAVVHTPFPNSTRQPGYSVPMAFKVTRRSRAAADAGAKRPAKKARHRVTAYSLDVSTFCVRPASRRVQAPRPTDEADNVVAARPAPVGPREAATIAYIKAHADRKDKLLVSSEQPHVRVRADAMRCLTVPLSQDGPERQISGVVLDASVGLLRRRLGADHRRNGRRVLLQCLEEQDWLEYLSSLPRTTGYLTEQDNADMSATAGKYLQHDMVFLPVNYKEHFFVAVLNFDRGEYQVLESENYAKYHGPRFYELALSKIRDGVGRCMEAAGRADVAGWEIRRVAGLPEQTDGSSCGLFALKCMELWHGQELTQSFSMDDVHALRTKLAEDLIFCEVNEMHDVKEEIKSKMRET